MNPFLSSSSSPHRAAHIRKSPSRAAVLVQCSRNAHIISYCLTRSGNSHSIQASVSRPPLNTLLFCRFSFSTSCPPCLVNGLLNSWFRVAWIFHAFFLNIVGRIFESHRIFSFSRTPLLHWIRVFGCTEYLPLTLLLLH